MIVSRSMDGSFDGVAVGAPKGGLTRIRGAGFGNSTAYGALRSASGR